jgi:rubrerythrin
MKSDVSLAVEALRQAMLNEKKTHDFYVEASHKVTDEKGRRMFDELAEQESVHMHVVRTQYESIKAGQGWTAIADFDRLQDVDIRPLQFKRANMEAQIRQSTTDLEALVLAAEMENNSFVFYTEQFAVAQDPLARAMYSALINAERSHFNTVMANWETLVHTGFWA